MIPATGNSATGSRHATDSRARSGAKAPRPASRGAGESRGAGRSSASTSRSGSRPPVTRQLSTSQRVSPYRTDAYRRLSAGLPEIFGAKTAKALATVGLRSVDDLLHHTPRDYLLGTQSSDLSRLVPGERVALVAHVQKTGTAPLRNAPRKQRLDAVLTDGTGTLRLTFFGRATFVENWQRQLNTGERGIFVGRISEFNGQLQMTHPDFVMLDAEGQIVGASKKKREQMEPVVRVVRKSPVIGIYPARAGLPTWQIAECVGMALDLLKGIDDPLPEQLRHAEGVPGLWEAFDLVHRPTEMADVERGMRRLKFDEALSLQLTMALRRRDAGQHAAEAIEPRPGGLLEAFDAGLPFALTPGQQEVSAEISADMARTRPMQRLLQGEVGSGKTVVALRAMITAVDAGHQAVLVAPTETLAEQHEASIRALMGPLAEGGMLGAEEHSTGLTLLTGSVTGKARAQALADIASGRSGLVVGTHALFGADVHFAELGLVVIDEQHRFGVEQRAMLADREATHPHELVLTATPIPRSVAMTVFGDLEVSTLRDLPRGRGQIQTTAVLTAEHPNWLPRVWQRVVEEVRAGHQCFVVCPRIGPKDDLGDGDKSSADAEQMYERLRSHELADLEVGLLHGRMPAARKREVMAGFAAGSPQVLVATTVVEVGVDVLGASAMVVLDADRFGISQLHQLRGRIGRDGNPGICLLVSGVDPRSAAAERLAALASTSDGFELAELDLAQRREGDVLGAEQSGGRTTLRLLRVLDDADLIARAKAIAEKLAAAESLDSEPGLQDMVTAVHERSATDWMDRD